MPLACRNPGISRRQFLSYLTVPAALPFYATGCVLANPHASQPKPVDRLAFADREGLGSNVNAPTVQDYFIPLHEEPPIMTPTYSQQDCCI
ncbi:MAG TPA: hypothetical protein VIM41_15820 [Gammaproteobacteria bacterium]